MDFFTYTVPQQGEVAGSTTAVQLPSRPCKGIVFKNRTGSTTTFYIGGEGVTVPNDATDITSGFALAPGESSPLLPCTNANVWFVITGPAPANSISYLLLT